jgi:serine/threonine-protein kinase
MSPEQMLSAKDVDARTDVWALGVILYELVTGKPVWHADTMQGLCALIASTPAPSLLLLAPKAPPLLADVVARCLAKSRDERIASVADLALALEPIAPAVARTSIERILRVGRKDRGVSTGPKLAPGAVHAADAASGIATLPGSPDATTNGAARRSSPSIGIVLAIAVAALLVVGIVVNAAVVRQAPGAATPLSVATVSAAPSSIGAASASASSAPVASASPAEESPAAAVPATPLASASVARRVVRAAPTAPASTSTKAAGAAGTGTVEPTAPDPKATAPAPSGNRALTDRK